MPKRDANRPPSQAEARYPPLGAQVWVQGVRMHLVDLGPRTAPAVALIHGASGNVRDFTFQFAQRLSDRYRVVALDRPGFGHSDRGPGPAHRPDRQARLMRGALAAIGVQRAILLGHSLGAASALAWALDAPQSVAGVLTLGGASHPWPTPVAWGYRLASAGLLGRVATAAIGALAAEDRAARALAPIFAPEAPPDGYRAYVGVGLALRPATIRANAEDIAHLKPFLRRQAPRYAQLAAPLEVMHGTADRIVAASVHAEALAAAAPNARLSLLDGVGHMPHHTHPEPVIAALARLAQGF